MIKVEIIHIDQPWRGRGCRSCSCSQDTLGRESRTGGRPRPKGTPQSVSMEGMAAPAVGSSPVTAGRICPAADESGRCLSVKAVGWLLYGRGWLPGQQGSSRLARRQGRGRRTGMTADGGRKGPRGRRELMFGTTAPNPLALDKYVTAPRAMASCVNTTSPPLLAPFIFYRIFPCHEGIWRGRNSAKICGAVLCNYDANGYGAELWVHICNCFPQGSICKILTEKVLKCKNFTLVT
jgi:hypothetical protein